MRKTISRECAVLTLISLLVMTLLYGVPLAQMVAGSVFSSSELGVSGRFVGLDNYSLFWRDQSFARSLLASAAFTVPSVVFQVGVAFAAALLTRRNLPAVGALRWMLMAPYFLPTVVVVIAWRFFSDPFVGLLPAWVRWLGFSSPDLRGPSVALPVMILVATYEAFPFTYVVVLARLLQIPSSLYEVTELTGASAWRTFVAVTWPQVSLTLGGLTLLRVLITWLKFDVPWLVYASQAPSPWGDTLAVFIYRTAFEKLQGGKAFASSLSLLAAAWAAYGAYTLAVGKYRRNGLGLD